MYGKSGNHVRRLAMIAAGVITTAALAAGCGSSSSGAGVASVGGSSKTSSGGSMKGGALAYSQCMRAHGLKDFPDPNSNGQIQISAGPGSDLIPTNPLFAAAQQACKSLQPGPPSLAQQHKDLAAGLKFARCMRSHGIPTFPDPTPQTGRQTQSSQSHGGSQNTNGIDANSPAFQSAMQKCRSLAPGGGLSVQSAGPGS